MEYIGHLMGRAPVMLSEGWLVGYECGLLPLQGWGKAPTGLTARSDLRCLFVLCLID